MPSVNRENEPDCDQNVSFPVSVPAGLAGPCHLPSGPQPPSAAGSVAATKTSCRRLTEEAGEVCTV